MYNDNCDELWLVSSSGEQEDLHRDGYKEREKKSHTSVKNVYFAVHFTNISPHFPCHPSWHFVLWFKFDQIDLNNMARLSAKFLT